MQEKLSMISTKLSLLRREDINGGSEDLVWKKPKIYPPKRGMA
jgi:hypothetical protein